MKGKYVLLGLLGFAVLLTAISCKSQPEPQPAPAPVETQPSTPATDSNSPDNVSLNALSRAANRAAAARKLVMDFEGPSFFPEDWQSAETLYDNAVQSRDASTSQSVEASRLRYEQAAAAYEAMIDKTYAAALDYATTELNNARDAAISAGANSLIPDELLDADNTVADAYEKYLAKDYYGAKDAALEAYDKYSLQKYGIDIYNIREEALRLGAEELIPDLLAEADDLALEGIDKYFAKDYDGAWSTGANIEGRYTALRTGLSAYDVRENIFGRGFEVYDPLNVDLADETLQEAADDYSRGNIASAIDKTETALFRYTLALNTAWENFAAEKGADASTERQKALDEKANVAIREDFNAAQAIYTRAATAFQAKRFEDAALLYLECEPMFTEAARVARIKRIDAERALELANQKMAESDETARNAEVILEGGN